MAKWLLRPPGRAETGAARDSRREGRRGRGQGPPGPDCTWLQKSSTFSYVNLIVPKAEATSGELDE